MAEDKNTAGKPRILLVDDEPTVLAFLKEVIISFGYDCDTASNGETALARLKQGGFTIVITDMVMPGLDGMQLLKQIKAEYPRIDVIVVTGNTATCSYTEVIRAGASDFIVKPFGIDEIEAKVRRVIREQTMVRRLEHLSMTDVLTDLFNRRCFELKLQEEIPRGHRQGYSVFLALIDVDRFKAYNDRYGHLAGDKVLQEVGRILRHCTRENVDWCFRFGGDEFAVIIPYATREQAVHIAQRILERYAGEERFAATGLSIGLARFVRHEERSWPEDIAEFVARADRALYLSKGKKGGHLVVDDEHPNP